MLLACHLKGHAAAHVACEAHVDACVFEYVVSEECGGGLSVAAGDADHLCIGVASGQFDFGDHGNAFLGDGLHHGSGRGNAGAFDHLVGREYAVHRVAPLFPFYTFVVEHAAIVSGYGSIVAEKHVHSFFLAEDGGAYAALTSAEYDEIFCHWYACCCFSLSGVRIADYLILRVTNVMTARKMPMIQKRVTIFDSGIARKGAWMMASMPELPGF